MQKYLKLLRVKHYIKNILVLLPLFFAGDFTNIKSFTIGILGVINFCLASSIVYVINDMRDVEKDRRHPVKCKRPLASGEINFKHAYAILFILIFCCIGFNYLTNENSIISWVCIFLYVVINLLYSFGLKNIVLLDVFILVIGYVLRLYYGAFIVNIQISAWLYLTVISMAFYLGLGKRRNELDKNEGKRTRKVLLKYNRSFLDKSMYMCLTLTIVFYSLWCEIVSHSMKSSLILISVPIVIIICMRYSLLIEGESDGDPIEVVYNDKVIVVLILMFIIFMIYIIYFNDRFIGV